MLVRIQPQVRAMMSISRRQSLAMMAGAAALRAMPGRAQPKDKVDPDHVAKMADDYIGQEEQRGHSVG